MVLINQMDQTVRLFIAAIAGFLLFFTKVRPPHLYLHYLSSIPLNSQ